MKGSDEDIEALFEKMQKMRRDLEAKVQDVCDLAGLSPAQIAETVQNPKVVSESAREDIDKKIEDLEQKLGNALKISVKGSSKRIEEQKTSDKRKKKMVGARRKWLEM